MRVSQVVQENWDRFTVHCNLFESFCRFKSAKAGKFLFLKPLLCVLLYLSQIWCSDVADSGVTRNTDTVHTSETIHGGLVEFRFWSLEDMESDFCHLPLIFVGPTPELEFRLTG
jgi:hypothetical protein